MKKLYKTYHKYKTLNTPNYTNANTTTNKIIIL